MAVRVVEVVEEAAGVVEAPVAEEEWEAVAAQVAGEADDRVGVVAEAVVVERGAVADPAVAEATVQVGAAVAVVAPVGVPAVARVVVEAAVDVLVADPEADPEADPAVEAAGRDVSK